MTRKGLTIIVELSLRSLFLTHLLALLDHSYLCITSAQCCRRPPLLLHCRSILRTLCTLSDTLANTFIRFSSVKSHRYTEREREMSTKKRSSRSSSTKDKRSASPAAVADSDISASRSSRQKVQLQQTNADESPSLSPSPSPSTSPSTSPQLSPSLSPSYSSDGEFSPSSASPPTIKGRVNKYRHNPHRKRFKLLRSFTVADFVTLGNAACGTCSIFFCLNYLENNKYEPYMQAAFFLLPLALIFDIADGQYMYMCSSSCVATTCCIHATAICHASTC